MRYGKADKNTEAGMMSKDLKALIAFMNQFPAIRDCLPLEIGIHRKPPEGISKRKWRRALYMHCNRTAYRKKLAESHSIRHALDGTPVTPVTNKERNYAGMLIKNATGVNPRKLRREKSVISKRNSTGPTLADELIKEAAKKRPTISIKRRRRVQLPAEVVA